MISIREVAPADADQVTAVINEAYIVEQFFVTGPRISVADVRTLMAKGTFLAGRDEAGRIVASVYAEPRGDRGYIGLLAVSQSLQGRGIGRRMMDAAETWLASKGCRDVDIRVVSLRTELPPFYEHLGYVQQGTEPFEDARKTKPCHFVLMSKPLQKLKVKSEK